MGKYSTYMLDLCQHRVVKLGESLASELPTSQSCLVVPLGDGGILV